MRKLKLVDDGDGAGGLSGAVLFGILWRELVVLLGTAASAAVLRRALRRALPHSPELVALSIERIDERYGYSVPPSFGLAMGPSPGMRHLLDELRPLLSELTGEVAQRHLERVPELRRWARASSEG